MPVFMSDRPRWTRRVLARADHLVAPSKFLARSIAPLGFGATVIPNVIELSAYRYRRRLSVGPRLLWMRSFHEIYNPCLAIRVLAIVKQTFPDATLVMAGPDLGLEAGSRRLVSELGLDESVRFAGFLNAARKVEEFDAADIYLNTNKIDNMPVSVVEAAASGLPVVATRVGGVPDLLTDGETALLVQDDDDRAMSQAVLRLIEHPDVAERLSGNGRTLAETCGAEHVMPAWDRLIDDVLRSRARAS